MPNFPRLLWYLANSIRREYWDSRRLRKYQEKRLRSVVKYAYDNVLFYHDLFRRAGVLPTDIKTVESLAKIPIVRKEELRLENTSRLISSESDTRKLKVVRTSGSTGQPFKVFISGKEDDWRKAIYMRANISCGQRPRDRWVAITSPHHFGDTTGIQRGLGIYAQNCISVFATIEDQVKLVDKAKPDVLDGYSGSLFLLAKEVKRREMKTICPRIIFGTADLLDEEARRFIQEVFEAPFYDQFGCAEVDRTAWQCPEKVGYHMDIDSVIIQFVDDEGMDVSPGEKGEIVYTSLFNYTQPLIRYGIKDIGEPLNDECPCGRTLPLMKVVEGRKDSFLIFTNGKILSPMGFWSIMRLFEFADHIDQFLVIQKKLDIIEIFVKRRDAALSERFLRNELVKHIEKCLNVKGISPNFRVSFVDQITIQKSGKLRSVISLLPLGITYGYN